MTGEFDSYNTPHRDSQMGASSGRICHHNGNVSVYECSVWTSVLFCMQVLWVCLRARKYMCGETVVLTLSGKRVSGGEVLWQVCDACYCDGSSHQWEPGLSETDNPQRKSSPWPQHLKHNAVSSSCLSAVCVVDKTPIILLKERKALFV